MKTPKNLKVNFEFSHFLNVRELMRYVAQTSRLKLNAIRYCNTPKRMV